MDPTDPMFAVAAEPPAVDEAVVAAVLASEYGLEGQLEALVSERDQNFVLRCAAGEAYVVKIAGSTEAPEVTQFQVAALRHLEQQACAAPVPRVIATRSGASITRVGAERHLLRVVSYLPGQPLESVAVDSQPAFDMGRCLASLDLALAGLAHPGDSQPLIWDMQRAGGLTGIIHHVPDTALREALAACLAAFETRVRPALSSLRSQVIHNDFNPGNVLVAASDPPAVSGIIDFGDMLRAPLVVDAAIAASYLRDTGLSRMRAFLAGYESLLPFAPTEKALFYDLVRTRLAATIAIRCWRASARQPDDPYLKKALAETSAEQFFAQLADLGRTRFDALAFSD